MMKKKLAMFLASILFLSASIANLHVTTAHAAENDTSILHAPSLLMTEVVPKNAESDGTNAYQFVEIYNNADKNISLKDYKLRYRYLENSKKEDDVLTPETEDITIPTGGSIVYWIVQDNMKTVADFNRYYNVNLIENETIVKVTATKPLEVNGVQGLALATNTGEDMAIAYYNEVPGVIDAVADKGILYTYSETPNDNMLKKYSSRTYDATPGSVTSEQIPSEKVVIPQDEQKPEIQDVSTPEVNVEQNDLLFSFNLYDNISIKTARLYYKTNDEESFKAIDLTKKSGSSLYKYTIPSTDLIGKEYVEYYLSVSDGTNTIESEKKRVEVMQERVPQGLSINIQDDTILSKSVLVKAFNTEKNSNTSLLIDQENVTGKTTEALESKAYLVMDVNKIDRYFENGVTIGNDVLQIFHDKITSYKTLIVPVDPKYFTKGKKRAFAIRSGTKVSPFDENSKENRDDFVVKNMRLILSDGTVLYDPKYADPEKEWKVGDSKGLKPILKISFAVPDEQFSASSFKWNTKSAKEGTHTIMAKSGKKTVKSTVFVDNTAPVIVPSIQKNKLYKGKFTINAELKDDYAGVQNVVAKLDDNEIALPFNTSSAALTPGSHTLRIEATDQAGNRSVKTTTFNVVEEQPYLPQLMIPYEKSIDVPVAPKLKVTVGDPTGDDLHVSFKKAYQYTANQASHIRAYENKTDNEPPKDLVSNGEQPIEDVDSIATSDKKYVTTTGTDKYPYHRFEVSLDNKVDLAKDEVEINWEGKSVIGRRVSLYVWNFDKQKWQVQEWKIANDNKNFKLNAVIKGTAFARDHKVQVLVQDEIAQTNQFNYSFVWMTDTQYYAKSYPQIYKEMTKWIVNQQDGMKIKYVFHTGDIIDKQSTKNQWVNADAAMKTLDDANVPYGVLAGNHDVNHIDFNYNTFYKYFGEKRFINKDYYGESYENNRGHYDLISEQGNDFLMLYMGWGIDEESIEWMNKILQKYPDRKAILNFHEYLQPSGDRSFLGNTLFEKVVEKNPNVILVLSGHFFGSETKVDEIDDNGDGTPDRKVYQMLTDYSSGPEGGQGFMRILQVNPIENKIYVKTYSPYLNKYNFYNTDEYPGKDEFVIETDLTPKEKVVATDSFNVNVYTNTKIGVTQNVKNNEAAKVVWKELENNTQYYWYADVTDDYQGKVRSPIWTFKTVETGDGLKDYAVSIKDANGTVLSQQTIRDDEALKLPKKAGYTFAGWYTDKSYKHEFDFDTMLKTKTVVYAKFIKNPQKPAKLSVSGKTYNQLNVSWKGTTDADGYIIYRAEEKSGKYEKIATLTNSKVTTYIDKKVSLGNTYFYKMRAYKNVENTKLYSSYTDIKSGSPILAKPTNLKAKEVSKDKLLFSWKPVSGALGYEIYKAPRKGSNYKKLMAIKGSKVSAASKNIKNGKNLDYKIRAYQTVKGHKIYSEFSTVTRPSK